MAPFIAKNVQIPYLNNKYEGVPKRNRTGVVEEGGISVVSVFPG